ncbi:hypothetical protein ABZ135_34350 [Streptomyces sp. NPDC006339]|uniref:hypothetical protein n=1 Tax=Streptomyces sp. NPDC006339 TaxID=3156755 RepID=UPI0033A09A35
MSRTARALAAFAALAGLVLGLVVCGSAAAAAAGTAAGTLQVAAPGPAQPGCGEGHGGEEGAAGPAVPPRSHGSGELLPAPAADRTPWGGWAGDQAVRETAPGPSPPERVPPSPVELSILRV